ncbi:MAG: outer membrane lipid asymmetry maintenance protein MlaD [Gammaproteobacteria bacterium]|nr:outer membrane lipid asymmetry maintenance protein MlaD [Gammaproteobacteria bacterium]
MQKKNVIEIVVGLFIIAGVCALFGLAFKVSGLSSYSSKNTITVTAMFNNIGDLKVRAPVKIAGVSIGEVKAVQLDPKSFRAEVVMMVAKNSHLPVDSSASILSASLLGSNYISIDPGFSDVTIKSGGEITETHPAIMLENLIGQAIFTPKDEDKKS